MYSARSNQASDPEPEKVDAGFEEALRPLQRLEVAR